MTTTEYPAAVQLQSKIHRWQKKHKVNGVPIPAKNTDTTLGYKAGQWGVGASGNAPKRMRFYNANRKPH